MAPDEDENSPPHLHFSLQERGNIGERRRGGEGVRGREILVPSPSVGEEKKKKMRSSRRNTPLRMTD